jgi:hypothetical protein
MSDAIRCRVHLGSGFLMLAFAAVAAAENAGTMRLELRQDRLTLHAREVSVERVLAQFADLLGIDVRGRPAESRRVNADFEAVPVVEAFERLLDRESFTLTYAASGALRSITLHGRFREPPRDRKEAGPAPPAVAVPTPPPPREGVPGAGQTGPTLVVTQPTLHGASAEQQVAVRAAASRTMLGAMTQNEEFLERLREKTGEGPEEFLARLATNAPSEDVRAGAAGALEDLQQRQAGQLPSAESHAGASPPARLLPAVQGRDRRRRQRQSSEGKATPLPAVPRR